ncbi:hypothetical protein WICPIJ_005244 [Wickerhamomyces pijperi]|uniref:Peptide:N-glycanase 1 n=1 Tax=Wickerhamomyces pijperi TaxID=599730 RepID=A0A9P8Q3X3_WICPI|nr:hypothetical protein WICPIJ_005244 [Wickerhamomyces pijperi]
MSIKPEATTSVDSAKIKTVSKQLLSAYKEQQGKLYQTQRQQIQRHREQILTKDQRLTGTLFNLLHKTVPTYESPRSQEITLDSIDLETIYSGVDEQLKKDLKFPHGDIPYDYVDCLVKELLRWYKNDFFKWVNQPETTEEQGPAKLVRVEQSNHQEQTDGKASITEVYITEKSKETIRFPRFNDPVKLLTWRQGRCGEWVNCFLLILRSLNIRARYVWNAEDHVWCEYFSPALNTWVHLDSCEESMNQPEIYCENWGKAMSYCIAVGFDCGVVDVSDKYITKQDKQLPRNKMSENQLKQLINLLNFEYMKDWEFDPKIFGLMVEANYEKLYCKRAKQGAAALHEQTVGRQSGDKEWTQARGEGGSS